MAITKDKKVSVIIPAYNESDIIGDCIKSFSNQNYKNLEVIVVDDLSDDQTALLAEKAAKQLLVDLKVIRLKKHQERANARNLGAKYSKGKYLIFIDADMQLNKDVLSESIDVVREDPTIKALIISEISIGLGFWANCKALEKKCYFGDDSIEAARFFEKKAFLNVGGWDSQMISGEDWDLTKRFRVKYKIGRVSARLFHNEGKLTLWQVAKKKFYYASKAQIYLKKYPLSLKDLILFIFRPAYFRNWRLFLSDPIHGIGVFILKFVEIIAGVSGYLYSRIANLP